MDFAFASYKDRTYIMEQLLDGAEVLEFVIEDILDYPITFYTTGFKEASKAIHNTCNGVGWQ